MDSHRSALKQRSPLFCKLYVSVRNTVSAWVFLAVLYSIDRVALQLFFYTVLLMQGASTTLPSEQLTMMTMISSGMLNVCSILASVRMGCNKLPKIWARCALSTCQNRHPNEPKLFYKERSECGLQVVRMLDHQCLYFSFQSMYIAWLIGRLTQLLARVNPRLGVMTLSLGLAAGDLGKFLLLLGGLLVMYARMGTVVFGPQAEEFSTLSKSFTTCFHMLMGNTSSWITLKKLIDPLKTIGAVFFWSFMLLVFTLLLNFVLVRNCLCW